MLYIYIPNMSHAGESISKMLDKKPAKEQGPKRYIIKSFYVMQHKKFSHTSWIYVFEHIKKGTLLLKNKMILKPTLFYMLNG